MQKIIAFIFISASVMLCQQKVIYQNDKFKITGSEIIEGEYKAEALSDYSLRSNYLPAFAENFNRLLTFKFAINGIDNERAPGQDHKIYLNPQNGLFETPLFVFAKDDPAGSEMVQGTEFPLLQNQQFNVVFKLDMRDVLKEFNNNGFYQTYNGDTLYQKDFFGVYIAGGSEPLSWDFEKLNQNNDFKLTDNNGDGIYEIKLKFVNKNSLNFDEDGFYKWTPEQSSADLPIYNSDYPILNSMYKMSLEEMLKDIREDGAFMAGAKWTGVWTRDISYSILLSLAIIQPDASKTSLMAKVKNGIIIQDTGTGGAWPVSTDRMTWALAAYQVYLTTGDEQWLKNIYEIISRSAEADILTIFDPITGLVKGESSFLDWREQTYPDWMDPKDIYNSKNLGTNVVHAATYKILAEISELLGKDATRYNDIYNSIKQSINKNMWVENKGYYGQFIYGRNYQVLSSKSESLGESLAVLFDIAGDRSESIIKNMPTTQYGTPCVYPQEKNIPPYHNDGVWPFVEAFRMWASKKVNNEEAAMHSLASIIRPAGLFLTNKENFVLGTGSSVGTEINSDRQLWSVAGNLAIFYRIIFGMEFQNNTLTFNPFVPKNIEGKHTLNNFRYGNGVYNVTINGSGNKISSFKINGKETASYSLKLSETGIHNIEIMLEAGIINNGQNIVENYYALNAPLINLFNDELIWDKIEGAEKYFVYRNGIRIDSIADYKYSLIINKEVDEYQISTADKNGVESFLSEPVLIGISIDNIQIPTLSGEKENVILRSSREDSLEFEIDIDETGYYSMSFVYANGSGPINTDNKCAIRSIYVDDNFAGGLIMPQRGLDIWDDFGFSNNLHLHLINGKHKIIIKYDDFNTNMNFDINDAIIKSMQLIKLNKIEGK